MTRDIRLDDITPVGRWIIYKDDQLTDPVVVTFEDLSVSYTDALEQTLGRKPNDKASYSKGIFGELKDGTKVIVANVINFSVDPDLYKKELGKFFYEHPEVSDNILETPFLRIYEVRPKMEKEAKLVRRYNKKHKRTEWALVSRSDPKKILRWFGPHKPSEERVLSEERRVQWFKHKGSVKNAWLVEETPVVERKDEYSFTKDDVELRRKWLIGPKDRLERKDIFGPHVDTEFGSGLLKKDKELYPWWEFTETPQFREKYAYSELSSLPEESEKPKEEEEKVKPQEVSESSSETKTLIAPVTTRVKEVIEKFKSCANQLADVINIYDKIATAFTRVKRFYDDIVAKRINVINLVDRKVRVSNDINFATKTIEECKSKLSADHKNCLKDLFDSTYEAYKSLLEVSDTIRDYRAELTREIREVAEEYQERMYSDRLTRQLTQETLQEMFDQEMEEFKPRIEMHEVTRNVLDHFYVRFKSFWEKLGILYNFFVGGNNIDEFSKFLEDLRKYLENKNFAVDDSGYNEIANELKSKFEGTIRDLSRKIHKIDLESFVRLVREFAKMIEHELPQVIPFFERLERIPVKKASLTKTSDTNAVQGPLSYSKEGAHLADPSSYLSQVTTLPDLLGAYVVYKEMSDNKTVSDGSEKFEKFFDAVEEKGLPDSGLDKVLRDSDKRYTFAEFLVDYSKKRDVQKIKEFFASKTYSTKEVQYLAELYKAIEDIDYESKVLDVVKDIIEGFRLPAEELSTIPKTEHYAEKTLFSVIDAAFKNESVRDILKKAIKNYFRNKFYEKVKEVYKETEVGTPLVNLLIEFLNKKYPGWIDDKTLNELKREQELKQLSLNETIEAIRKKYPDLTSVLNVFKSLVSRKIPTQAPGAFDAVSNLLDFLAKKHGIDLKRLPPEYWATFTNKSETIIDILEGHGYLPKLPPKILPTKEIDLDPIYNKFAGILKQLYDALGPLSEHLNIYLTRQEFKDRIKHHINVLIDEVLPDVEKELSEYIESLGPKGEEIFNTIIKNCAEYFTNEIFNAFLMIV
jgi:hypothetical protein